MPIAFALIQFYILIKIINEIGLVFVLRDKHRTCGLLFNGNLTLFISSKASACLL
jgi:hypothetical protein